MIVVEIETYELTWTWQAAAYHHENVTRRYVVDVDRRGDAVERVIAHLRSKYFDTDPLKDVVELRIFVGTAVDADLQIQS